MKAQILKPRNEFGAGEIRMTMITCALNALPEDVKIYGVDDPESRSFSREND
jgi:hypothetical protein